MAHIQRRTDNMDKDYKGIPIKEYKPAERYKRYYRERLTDNDIRLLEKVLFMIKANGKGDPIKSGLSVAYVGINGTKRVNREVIFVDNTENLIDRILDLYNLYGVHVGCSLYAQNIPDWPIAEIKDGYFRLV